MDVLEMTLTPFKLTKKQLFAVYAALGCLFIANTYFFYLQSTGVIYSDLPVHIQIAESGTTYSFSILIMRLLQNYVLISAYLSFMVILSIVASWILLRYLSPGVSPFLLFIVSVMCNFEIAIYIPSIGPMYLGAFHSGVWHNSTYIALKPFAALVVLFFLKIYKEIPDKMPVKEMFVLTGLLTLSTAIKPNFFISFAPSAVIFLLCDTGRYNRKCIARTTLLLALSLLPSVIVGIIQSQMVFTPNASVKFGVLTVFSFYTKFPIMSLLRSLMFPIFALLFCGVSLNNKPAYSIVCLNACLSLFYSLFLYEANEEFYHGNFFWSAFIATFLLFLIAAGALCNWCKQNSQNPGKTDRIIQFALWSLFIAHFLCGCAYYMLMWLTKTFII